MWPFRANRSEPSYSLLVDSANRTILAISPSVAAIEFVHEAMVDTLCLHHIDRLYPNNDFSLSTIPPKEYPEWTMAQRGVLKRTRPDLVTPAARERSALAVEKVRVIADIMRSISMARYPVMTGIWQQETVYINKRLQAIAFRDAGYPEDVAPNYPYVLQYADLTGSTLRQAADDIIFKAKLDEDFLAKTELLRLKYFRLVREAEKPEEVAEAYKAFVRESYKNALV